jgi:hypothetical protein
MRKMVVYVLLLLAPIINNVRVVENHSESTIPVDFYDEVKLADIGLSINIFD